jgi:hypothetical protein
MKIRKPKSEVRKKSEIRNPKWPSSGGWFGIRISSFFRISAFGFRIFIAALLSTGSLGAFDLTNAVLVSAPNLTGPERNALRMLVEEVEKRTGMRWVQATNVIASSAPIVVVDLVGGALATEVPTSSDASKPEGYRLIAQTDPARVFIIGNDSRGLLFGCGRLLRELHMERGRISIDENLNIVAAPKYPLRGHQLGYRPKCNSYDAWDLPVWEQYFRDLAVFGCNAIELIPPRSDDAATSPHFPRPPMEMMQGMSRLADDYGLDVWIWYPAMDSDYANEKTVEFALREWGEVFSKLRRIDAVFVPGGDPGHTQPKVLMQLLEKQTENLHRFHPKAQMWVSPQSFNQAWLEEFLAILREQQPAWLTGVVYGPQIRVSIAKLRELVPAKYPIRHYPDITHSRQCQYPVPNWDVAFAVTEGRECINPRPEGEAIIFRKTQPGTIGFITYSEGCNDDVNKIVWSALGWDPETKVTDILRQYSRYFISERYQDEFAQGLLALERNWNGPLARNEGVERVLEQFQQMEKAARPADLKNWRFEQALFRAYYDGYLQHRLNNAARLEEEAMARLRTSLTPGSLNSSVSLSSIAIEEAGRILDRPPPDRMTMEWRTRIFQLAEALFQSIGMQLSVEQYKAIAVDRGASLDTLDFPLNNRVWLEKEFARISELPTEAERIAALRTVVEWTNPGPGGFYDDLGNPSAQPHLLHANSFKDDPGCYESCRVDFEEEPYVKKPDEPLASARRMSWLSHAESLYDEPLEMAYSGLDTKSAYKLRVVYAGDSSRRKIRLDGPHRRKRAPARQATGRSARASKR